MLGQRPQGGPVGVPLLALAEEEAVVALALRVRGQHLGRLGMEPVPVQRSQEVRGITEPEPVVGEGSRSHLVALVEEHQEAPARVHGIGQASSG